MTKPKLAILSVHGMGEQKEGYSKTLEQNISSHFEGDFAFEEIVWAPITQIRQRKIWEAFTDERLSFKELRRFFVFSLGDAIIYRDSCSDGSYNDIHQKLSEGLSRLADNVADDAVLVVISHSLGTICATDWIWDLTQRKERLSVGVKKALTPRAWALMDRLSLLYTLASPLAIFSGRFERPETFTVPHPKLLDIEPVLPGGWYNIFDAQDVIAYPLANLGGNFSEIKDLPWRIAPWRLKGYTPFVHTEYWRDSGLGRHIGEKLRALDEALRPDLAENLA